MMYPNRSADFEPLVAYLQNRIEMGRIPGCVVAIGTSTQLLFQKALGFAQVYPKKRIMTENTLFDLASLTKVVAALPSVMQLCERGAVQLDAPVSRYLPEFKNDGKDQVTLWHLLTHTSGLPSSACLYGKGLNKQEALAEIFQIPLQYSTGKQVVYSDVGFMLLGLLVERVTGLSLDQYAAQSVFLPLRMADTRYNPSEDQSAHAAATEYRIYLDRYQCAEVHDENATEMGGVSGHAGLFSTIGDLSRYAQCFLQEGTLDGFQLLKPETVRMLRKLHTPGLDGSRGIGWVYFQSGDSSFAEDFKTPGFGHTGYTGTSLYMNPDLDLFVILLSNRVHFGRTDDIQGIRKIVHGAVASVFQE